MVLLKLILLGVLGSLMAFFPAECEQKGGLKRRYAQPPQVVLPPSSPQLKDYVGCIHIHSHFSHDSRGTYDEILKGAKVSGCDFLMITDHGNLKFRRHQGMNQGVLFICGAEISTKFGHILALGTSKMPSKKNRKSDLALFKEITKLGGVGIVAHPDGDKSKWKGGRDGFQAMEIFNLGTEAKKANKVKFGAAVTSLYARDRIGTVKMFLRRTTNELALYDKISLKRHLVLIGSVDAHAIPVPGGGKIETYAHQFPLVRIHVLARDLTQSSILKAFARGQTYTSFDVLADATGFSYFALLPSGKVVMMGSQIGLVKGTKLAAIAPQDARFVLYHNGQSIFQHYGTNFLYQPTLAGVYRLEVRLGDRETNQGPWYPWIYSNPIWLTKSNKK